jgi:hypothetical protein
MTLSEAPDSRKRNPAVTILHILGLIVLTWLAGWLMIQSYGNFWAAGGPPNPDPSRYEARGHLLLAGATVPAVGALLLLLSLLKRRRRKFPL